MSYPEIPKEIAPDATSSSSSGFKLIPNRIFVGGMSRETTEEDLLRYFSAYGNVKSAKIITDIVSGASKGYGFVTFASEEEALRIQQFGGIAILHNRKLNIGPAIKRNVVAIAGLDPVSSNTVTSQVKSAIETSSNLLSFPASSALFPGLSMDPTTAMLYHPFYGFSYLSPYLYPGSHTFQFPY